ncbi:branched-chain amino acid ABC transporter permease [Alphaproteobacteria bacterium 46_93_T64]|nr:branched-chain amino acid ABC transporter permease [Alphaproteobacteria bacterium 46_93_T64]
MQSQMIKSMVGPAFAAILIMCLLPVVLETYTLTLLVVYGMLGLSLGLIWGYGGILCFGQAAFFGLGAYSYAIAAINIGESTVPVFIGILVPAVVAFLLGAMMFYGRLADVYMGVITLVFTLILFRFMNSTAGPDFVIGKARLGGFNGIPGYQTLNVPGFPDEYIYGDALYYLAFSLLIVIYLLLRWFLKTSFGRTAIAIRENEERVELMGYDVRIRKTLLFSLGGGIAGLAGVLYANWAEIVTPGLFSLGQSAEIIIWCIVGGLGMLVGPIFGGMLIGLMKFLLGQQSMIDNTLILGLVLVLFVLFLPKGVVPTVSKWLPTGRTKSRKRRRKSQGRSRKSEA